MNNRNKIVSLGYQLATIMIELMLFLLLNIYLYLLLTINCKNENIMGIIIINS